MNYEYYNNDNNTNNNNNNINNKNTNNNKIEIRDPYGTVVTTSWISGWYWFWLIFFIFWVILGFFGYLMALVCVGNRGTNGEKILGLLIAIFLGPFYWLYYVFSSTYCTAVQYAGKMKK